MTWIEYLLNAAQKSKWNLELWVRYLNKVIQRDKILLSKTDIDYLMSSEELTSFQRVFLELALEKETTHWEMTVGMSEPTQSIHLQSVLKELKKE